MKQLLLIDASTEIAQRLSLQGWSGMQHGSPALPGWQPLTELSEADRLPSPRLWLSASGRKPTLAEGDVLLDVHPDQSSTQTVAVRWQASPFAVAHGFLLTVGGPAQLIRSIEPLLDALAPSPGAWLHAGGLGAPAFLTEIMNECGGGLAGLAPLFLANPASGLDPFWQGQSLLSDRLAGLAAQYLATSKGERYEPLHALPPVFALTPPNGAVEDSPARKLACLLVWLHQQGHASAGAGSPEQK